MAMVLVWDVQWSGVPILLAISEQLSVVMVVALSKDHTQNHLSASSLPVSVSLSSVLSSSLLLLKAFWLSH